MFYSYNIFNYEDKEQPLKKQFKADYMKFGRRFTYDLVLHDLEISDDIYSPFESQENY